MLVNVSIKFMMANDGNAKRTPRKALQKVDKYLTAPQHGKKLYHDISEALKRCNKIKSRGNIPAHENAILFLLDEQNGPLLVPIGIPVAYFVFM